MKREPPTRRINAAGLDLIKRFEGFRPRPYLCPAGYATIGYGHVIKDPYGRMQTNLAKAKRLMPGPITQAEGAQLLRIDLEAYEDAISNLVKVDLTDNQFAALVSFAYNVGIRAFANSTLRKLLNRGDYDAVPEQLGRWVHAGGRRLTGLVNRRVAETALFRRAHRAQSEAA